jgi:hypothetical protein
LLEAVDAVSSKLFMPIAFFQITAAYSNAVLVAVMPYFSNFAKTLDLPTPQPVTQAQVWRFNCFPRSDHIGGRVILTNGCEFIFDHGHVENFVSPRSFFYLQNPDLIPKFYGPVEISEAQALQIAHDAIKKLDYSDAMLCADKPPEITLPKYDRSHYIARYLIRWRDTTRGDPNAPPTSAEFEEDATSGQIVMVNIVNPNAYRPDLNLSVRPPVVGQFGSGSLGRPAGQGRIVAPVTSAYALTFLNAILPQISDFVNEGNLTIKAPTSAKDIDMSRYLAKYNCGIIEGDTMAYIDTKAADRFVYRHGQVIAFYASDARDNPERKPPSTYPGIDQEQAKFFGPVNMTTDEAVNLVRQTVKNLGYSETVLHMDDPPRVTGPGWWGTNRIARCFIVWREKESGVTYVNAEVDVANKMLKSLYINDDAVTNIWRKPPKLDN